MKIFVTILKSAPAFKRGLILFLLPLFFYSCATGYSSIYNFDYPLTEKTAKSNSSLIEIKIPLGWFVAEDNEHLATDLWLVKDDYSATIKFIMVNLNEEKSKSSSINQLERIAEINKQIIKAGLGKSFSGFNDEKIELGTKIIPAFQYNNQVNQPVRTIIFSLENKYFELTAFASASSDPSEIFKVQNSVLASIK